MARGVDVVVVLDKLPVAQSRLRPVVSRGLRTQAFQTESDMKGNIVGMGLVDTGLMLNTTRARQTGELEWEVGPSAESAGGYPYPVIQNFGGVRIPASPFATNAGEKAARELPDRFRNIEGQLL